MELTSKQIQEIIPHRYPFLLVDKITDYEPGKWGKGIKCVSANEMHFMGHFPGEPVMPGVLIVEALAQVGAIVTMSVPENRDKLPIFGKINNCRFRQPVLPGDVLELSCEITKQKGPVGVGMVVATVDGKIAASAELTFMLVDRS